MVTVVFQEWLEALTVKIESFYDGVLPALISVCPRKRLARTNFDTIPEKRLLASSL
jgi:hypothetical protein